MRSMRICQLVSRPRADRSTLEKVAIGVILLLALMGCMHVAAVHAQGPVIQQPSSSVPPPGPEPFYWIDPTQQIAVWPETQPSPPPPLPDLSVQWIERLPHYRRYCVDYGRGLPELCAGTEDDKRFPDPGEVVTFTAEIANQGVITSPAVAAIWTVGQIANVSPGWDLPSVVPPLAPGITTTLTITWPWPSDPFTVTLSLDPASTLVETSRANNVRGHRTDGLYLDVAVHPLVDAAFARRPNLVGSWSFADWMQAQVDTMNANLAASAYPSAPHRAVDKVRIDRILVTEDVGGDTVTSTLDFDGRWTFRVEADDPDTPEDEAALSAENYAASFAQHIDWGLIHELTHQLGAIDLYQLNVAGSYQNEVIDGDGRPLLMGFDWTRPDLMGGGDRGDYPWFRYSEHTALALNQNTGHRRGYFGEYLYDLPGQATLRVLDIRGQPLPGALVTAYQTEFGTVRGLPAFSGLTDANGRFVLPARDVPFGGLATATGHTLAPNPFGAIDVVGRNGQMLLQISRNGQNFYTWWTVTDFNLARWHGLNAVERSVATHLPASASPAPPPHLDGRVDGLDVTLAWPASPSPGIVAYRIYRGEEPAFYPFAQVATTSDLAYSGESGHTARYAVTAVDAQGRESGLSPVFRAQRLIYPGDIAVDPATGTRTIIDRHDGALVTQLADDRWVGRQGSVHLGLTGSEALTRNEQGQLLVAVTGEDRIKVIDPVVPVSDSVPQVINWFGRDRFVTGTLAGPAGVVQAGPAFTVDLKPQPDASTLGLASFDNRLDLSGAAPLHASGVTLAPGRFDGGLRINGSDRLEYDPAGHLDPNQGSLELWVRPEWVWDDDEEHVFVEVGPSPLPSFSALGPVSDRAPHDSSYHLRLAKASWNGLYAWLTDGTHDLVLYSGIDDWQPGQWHHLAVAWQAVQPGTPYHRYTLWIDGILRDSQVLRRPVDGVFDRLSVGAGLDATDQADAVLDELRLSSLPRLGNSQQARLIISQRTDNTLAVTDWLGNLVSRLGGPGAALGQFSSPQGLEIRDNRIWVADPGNGRVQVLTFDGDRLTPSADWTDGLLRPVDISVAADGRLLIADQGDDQVKLVSSNGNLLRRWTGPTDGHPGPFRQPAGLIWLPNGDALVADAGNGRIVRIAGPLGPAAAYFPLITASSHP